MSLNIPEVVLCPVIVLPLSVSDNFIKSLYRAQPLVMMTTVGNSICSSRDLMLHHFHHGTEPDYITFSCA